LLKFKNHCLLQIPQFHHKLLSNIKLEGSSGYLAAQQCVAQLIALRQNGIVGGRWMRGKKGLKNEVSRWGHYLSQR